TGPAGPNRLAIMGDVVSSSELRQTWTVGTNELGARQDDVARLTGVLGLRPAGPGRDAASATPLRAVAGGVNRLAGSGVVGSLADVDYFAFRVASTGTVTLRLNFGVGVDPTQAHPQDG